VDGTHRPTHLADLVEVAAARHADHAALVDAVTGAALTWAELDATVSAEARRLTAAGVEPGDRVVVGCVAAPALAVGVLGALRAGAVAVPAAAGDVAAVAARATPRVLVQDGSPDGGDVLGPPDLDARGERVAAVGGGEDLALLLHTSAGQAVCLSHRAVLANRAQAAALRPAPVTPVDRVMLTVPLFHAYGLAAGLLQVCWAGATAVLPAPGRPVAADLADAVARHWVSALAGAPSVYRALLDLPADRLRTDLAGLRLCTCGGGLLPRPWAAAFQEATGHRIVEGYGLTQAGPVVTSTPLDGVAEPGSVGRPLPGIELRLVDGEGRPLAFPRSPAARSADPSTEEESPAAAGPGRVAEVPATAARSGGGTGRATHVRGAASRVATDVRAAAERGVAEFRAAAERAATEVRVAAERAATEVRAAVRAGDPVGDMIDDAQDVEGSAHLEVDIGRIAVRGPNLFSGYWPGCTDGPDADGWFVTADMGFLDASGALHLVDRSSDLVVVSGFTVYPHEVERVLGELPAVADAAVVGVPDERTGQAVRAVVVRAPGADLDDDAVRGHCRARLARFKVPAQVVFVDELPRTPAGRLARHLLVDRPTDG
jgi:long-chain acyl-CoA synthetase